MPEIAGLGVFTDEQWASIVTDHGSYTKTRRGISEEVVAEILHETEDPVTAWAMVYAVLRASPSANSISRLRALLAAALIDLHHAERELQCWRVAFGDTALKDATDRLRDALAEVRAEPERGEGVGDG